MGVLEGDNDRGPARWRTARWQISQWRAPLYRVWADASTSPSAIRGHLFRDPGAICTPHLHPTHHHAGHYTPKATVIGRVSLSCCRAVRFPLAVTTYQIECFQQVGTYSTSNKRWSSFNMMQVTTALHSLL